MLAELFQKINISPVSVLTVELLHVVPVEGREAAAILFSNLSLALEASTGGAFRSFRASDSSIRVSPASDCKF
jgi:hypothetical protein